MRRVFDEEKLIELWMYRGLAATEVAEAMGHSRGAVLARVYRLGLSRPATPANWSFMVDEFVDYIANPPLNRPVGVREAATKAGIAYDQAKIIWGWICRRYGERGIAFNHGQGDRFRPVAI